MHTIYIGTSGWNYKDWRTTFYSEKLSPKEWLAYYARHFHTVEINNSFYHLPTVAVFKKWFHDTPPHFIFSVKGSRFITHMKKLKEPHEITKKFLTHVSYLKEKLGPILFQLPPRWKVNRERLASFINALPQKGRYVFEFRDNSWFTDAVFMLLEKNNIAFCVHDMMGSSCPSLMTGSFAYMRFHGTLLKYDGKYSHDQLMKWRSFIQECHKKGDVYIYFNNDTHGYAIQNAQEMKVLCAQ